jgi:hypothetical protein
MNDENSGCAANGRDFNRDRMGGHFRVQRACRTDPTWSEPLLQMRSDLGCRGS